MLTDRSRRAIAIAPRFSRTALACSTLAMAVALTSAPGRAQSFLAGSTTTFGSAVVTTGTNTTTITISSPSAVIDWTPTDTATSPLAITYQPNGTTATFTSATPFTVLNRIVPVDPTRAIAFDGIVNSLVNGSPGGTVFFYSPGGIFLSPNAQFNVGNLGLTSAAPFVDGSGNWYTGNQVQFQAANAGSFVNTLAGAQINAPAAGSYVAIVAPRIDQRAAITVNGQAALVSADAATITFNPNGLFDIQVNSGTSATGTTLFNSGAITGPASTGAGVNQRIYAVAVPKNTAITLAIGAGSTLGFNIAGAADVVGNAVVLSAGKNIVAGNIATGRSAGGGTGAADLNIANTAVTSSLRGASTDETFFFSIGGGTASTASTVNLQADTRATYTADGAGSVTTGNGMVTLDAQRSGNGVTGGRTDIFAINNGSLSITSGGATLNSRGFGFNGTTPGSVGGNATGGMALIQALSGGDVSITGPVNIQGGGFGGAGNAAAGGTGTGGLSQIFARDAGSSITINGLANLGADGIGGVGNGGAVGGIGTGGQTIINAQVAASNGISITGAAGIGANGIGGNANNGPAGAGFGGLASAAASVNNNLQFGAALNIFASGTGGNAIGGGATGNGTGGTARINLFSTGTMSVAGNVLVHSLGQVGTGNPNSGIATGNIAAVTVQQSSVLNVTGLLQVSASGLGDRSPFGFATNGSGVGGTASLDAFTNGAINIGGVLRVRSDALAANGGNSSAGTAIVAANSGGDITASQLNVTADGVGGTDTGTGAGFGRGGTATLIASGAGSTVTIANGNSTGMVNLGELDFISAEGFGGQNNGGGSGVGGAATGGTSSINVNSGAVLTGPANTGTQGFVRVIARATGGNANTGATAGGFATGGTINITVDNATMTSAGLLPSLFALGGSFATGATGNIVGGSAVGGSRNINVLNGGNLTTAFSGGSAGASGGNGLGNGRGGDGSGGSATLLVDNGSTLALTGSSGLFTQNGGGAGGATGTSGNSSGGNVFARVANGSTLSMAGPASNNFFVSADAFGSFIAPQASATGSNSTAGTATFVIDNATANLQTVNVSANGNGGGGLVGQGGTGTGGSATLQLIGATLNADSVRVDAFGFGGTLEAGQSGVAGSSFGGTARLIATGGASTATIASFAEISASGDGGNIRGAPGTTTGDGTGGFALLLVNGGASLTLNVPEITLLADGEGGRVGPAGATADIGGDGTGGLAEVFVNGGNLTVNGDLSLEADNLGGEGIVGGDGLVRTDGVPNALLHARNGSITVTGVTQLSSRGEVDIEGNGGNASGGLLVVDAQNNLSGPSTITLGDLFVDASALAGSGFNAPAPSQPGGRGGDAFGGAIQIFGNAGNGNLVVNGTSLLNASASGGAGGTGHPGATGTAGGAGGDATGGFIQFGTRSGLDTGTVNTGSASFGVVSAIADGTGGSGGAGGSGTTSGPGGTGGDGFGGAVGVLVRGSAVTLNGTVSLSGSAFGGAGGSGLTQGAGGDSMVGNLDDATSGNLSGVNITVTSRFNQPTQLGSLTGGSVFGSTINTPGAGSTPGTATIGDSPISVMFDGGTGNLGTIDFVADGSLIAGTFPSLLALNNATLNVTNTLSLETPGALSVSLGSSTLNIGNLTLDAGNFVLPAVRPTTLGTINVSGLVSISSALDFLAYANFNTQGGNFFDADGSVLIGDYTSTGSLAIDAVGGITTGNVQVNGDADLFAGGPILTAAITAGGDIDLETAGAIATAALTAGDTVTAVAGGALSVGNVSAGIVNPSTATGAEYNVGLRSLASVTAGSVNARGSVGLSSPGTINVGDITSGLHVLGLAGTGFTSGAITTPQPTTAPTAQVLLANFSLEALGGQIGNTFNPAPVLASTSIMQIAGPVTINGGITTGLLRATGSGVTSVAGPISTRSSAILIGNAGVMAGAITAGLSANLLSNAGSITAGAITAADSVIASGATGITLGNVSAGLVNPTASGLYKIAVASINGAANTGNLLARGDVGVQAAQSIAAGNIAGRDILLLPGTSLSTGSIQALVGTQPLGRIYISNVSLSSPTNGNVFAATFTNLPLFNLAPVRIGGPITIAGAVNAGSLIAATAQGISLQAVSANLTATGALGFIDIDAGGMAMINGALRAGDSIDIASGDIDIAAGGSIDALSGSGEIQLASNNPNGAFIGDGLTSTGGYRLSQAEYARLRAGEIAIIGDDISGLATDLTIGTLTINATQVYGANGIALFASGNRATETPSGILRIAGAVTANGFAPTTSIELLSGTVEIEAERGSLKVNAGQSDSSTSGSSSLGGLIYVEADRIHVASDAILTKLRADPLYTGHIDELNAPAAVQRPDGVFNALGFEINVGETFYVQNTGSRVVPAGFVTTFDNTDVFASGDRPGGVEIVINGQFQTSTGTVTGRAAFDQVIADPTADSEQFFGFSETSQLNGCVFLSRVCAFGQSDPVAAISSEISVIISPVLAASPPPPAVEDAGPGDSSASSSDSEAAAEDADSSDDEKKDEGDGDEAASPIAPPTPLISTRALDGDVNVVEPVSGAGNPALFGSAVDETTVQGEKP